MGIKPIRTENEHTKALSRIGELWGGELGTPEGDELDVLLILCSAYEEEHFHIETPHPVEAVKFHMEQHNIEKSELNDLLGGRSRVSEFFNKKRELSLSQIKKLHKAWNIPVECLIDLNP